MKAVIPKTIAGSSLDATPRQSAGAISQTRGPVSKAKRKAGLKIRKPKAEVLSPARRLAMPAPTWMTDSQRSIWAHAAAALPYAAITDLNSAIFAIWVESADRHRRAMQAQAKLDGRANDAPMLHKGEKGRIVPSPYLGIMDRAAAIMLRAADQLGFTPPTRPYADIDLPVADNRADLVPVSAGRDLVPF